jgi:2'-5' RNA ligase
MRLFTGLDVPPAIADALSEWQDLLRRECSEIAAGIRWSPAGNLHITTKFIGDWPEARLQELTSTLARAIPRRARFTLVVPGIESMTNAHHGSIVYAQVVCPGGSILQDLAQDTDRALHDQLGISVEPRAYRPHVTLGRSRQDDSLLREVLTTRSFTPLTFEVTEFCLYQSAPSGNGTVYSKVSAFPFAS